MEPKLSVHKEQSEWICCEYGLLHRVSVCVAVENGKTLRAARLNGLRDDGETIYVKFEVLKSLLQILPPFINEVMEARERTYPYDPDDPALNTPIEKLHDEIEEFEAAARLAEEGM